MKKKVKTKKVKKKTLSGLLNDSWGDQINNVYKEWVNPFVEQIHKQKKESKLAKKKRLEYEKIFEEGKVKGIEEGRRQKEKELREALSFLFEDLSRNYDY